MLCSLCVGNSVAVRSNQNLIMNNLMPGRDLLLQTSVVDYVYRYRWERFKIVLFEIVIFCFGFEIDFTEVIFDFDCKSVTDFDLCLSRRKSFSVLT